MSSYSFPDIVCKLPQACDDYIKKNIDWVSNYNGINNPPLTILTVDPLTELQLTNLTTLLNNYTEPNVWLTFDHVETYPLHSHFTNDIDNSLDKSGNIVLQTWIFSTQNSNNTNTVLDDLKTIVEYKCDDVQQFLNITSGNSLQTGLYIKDISRNIDIAYHDTDINDIITIWHNAAVSGTTGGNIQYKTIQYSGLMSKDPNYDVIWQLSTPSPSETIFSFRCHTMQYIYYAPIYPV